MLVILILHWRFLTVQTPIPPPPITGCFRSWHRRSGMLVSWSCIDHWVRRHKGGLGRVRLGGHWGESTTGESRYWTTVPAHREACKAGKDTCSMYDSALGSVEDRSILDSKPQDASEAGLVRVQGLLGTVCCCCC